MGNHGLCIVNCHPFRLAFQPTLLIVEHADHHVVRWWYKRDDIYACRGECCHSTPRRPVIRGRYFARQIKTVACHRPSVRTAFFSPQSGQGGPGTSCMRLLRRGTATPLDPCPALRCRRRMSRSEAIIWCGIVIRRRP